MREKCESKHKFGGIKVCKAEQIRKQCASCIICGLGFRNSVQVALFVVWVSEIVCKLHYLQFEFQKQCASCIICSLGFRNTEQVVRILQFSQENTCTVLGSLFNKYAGLKACNFIKKRLQHRSFPVKFAEFLRIPFFTEYTRWLLLETSHELSLLHLRTMYGVISWYVLALQRLFHFIAYLSISFLFLIFFVESITFCFVNT